MDQMHPTIVRMNIARFESLLRIETDPEKLRVLRGLLEEARNEAATIAEQAAAEHAAREEVRRRRPRADARHLSASRANLRVDGGACGGKVAEARLDERRTDRVISTRCQPGWPFQGGRRRDHGTGPGGASSDLSARALIARAV